MQKNGHYKKWNEVEKGENENRTLKILPYGKIRGCTNPHAPHGESIIVRTTASPLGQISKVHLVRNIAFW